MSKHTRTEPAPTTVAPEEYSAGQAAENGTKVQIEKGQVPDQEGTTTVENAGGLQGRIDGDLYESKAGPNKGRLMQPVRVNGRGKGERLLSVPVEDVKVDRGGSKSRGNFSTGIRSEEQHKKIFGARKGKGRWIDAGPGKKRLVYD